MMMMMAVVVVAVTTMIMMTRRMGRHVPLTVKNRVHKEEHRWFFSK